MTGNDLSLFAYRLNELMIENNLNASKLAEQLDVDKSTVSRYLSAETAPSVDGAIRLSNLFHYRINFILGIDNNDKKTDFKDCSLFSERLALLFESKHKTQYALKKQKKISQSLVYYWLHGKYEPSLDNLVKLAEFFECSVDYVLGRVDYD